MRRARSAIPARSEPPKASATGAAGSGVGCTGSGVPPWGSSNPGAFVRPSGVGWGAYSGIGSAVGRTVGVRGGNVSTKLGGLETGPLLTGGAAGETVRTTGAEAGAGEGTGKRNVAGVGSANVGSVGTEAAEIACVRTTCG